ncbi:A/G-specific adenine glycosylase [Carnobacteriaceae bacterium zg-ZUI252]|nr:A/G-specific adenine glycosylase [Carnobacteriaceae bacterium zg-ZUI252]MBS4770509.1 A/G-specific adenine glycosylase [Carnobacteriaceae bacterium zg-ZUI240]
MTHKLLNDNGITLWNDDKINRFRATLLEWYDANKRDLPWRQTKDPYAIWVSEIMLQQTQVVTVIPYFKNFMHQFPTISALASAPEQQLLKAWEGLGYYSRVRNMQTASQQIMNHYNGVMPNTYDELLKLKGIGNYTAGAIASIAFGKPVGAVDGNVMRVMARLFEINLDIGEPKNRKVFEYLTNVLIDPERPGDFNQALMDLGSDICSAKNPKPEISPIRAFNQAYIHGTMDKYPIKRPKTKQQHVFYDALVIENDKGEFLLQQRQNKGLLANMWTFPLIEIGKDVFESNEDVQSLGQVTHLFSHLKWHIRVISSNDTSLSGQWVHPKQFDAFPMPTPQLKMLALIKR